MIPRAFFLVLVAAPALLNVSVLGQVTNDNCPSSVIIAEGAVIVGSNVGATTGPEPVACNGGNDVWYALVLNCNAQYVVSTCAAATNFDTVLSVWTTQIGCGALVPVGCSDNNCALAGHANASRVTFTATAGSIYVISVAGRFGAVGTFSLQVSFNPVMTLGFFNVGPGTLGYAVTGPPNGVYFTAVSLIQGAFPFGWFYGVDMPLFEIVAEFNVGPPFVGIFSPCGTAIVGPFGGIPSGLTVYAVSVGFAPGATFPGYASNPAVGTAP